MKAVNGCTILELCLEEGREEKGTPSAAVGDSWIRAANLSYFSELG